MSDVRVFRQDVGFLGDNTDWLEMQALTLDRLAEAGRPTATGDAGETGKP